MIYQILVDLLVVLHGLFILYVLLGALLNYKYPRLMRLHIPVVIWGVLVEYFHWICPLTPLEKHFRTLAGNGSYEGDFIEHYLVPIIYPENLTDEFQFVFGSLVVIINGVLYGLLIVRWKRNGNR